MKKVILGLIVALAIAGIIIVRNARNDTTAKSNPDNKPVVKIGAQFPLTGNMADNGIAARKALAKSIEDANNNPENKLYYELLVEDNQFSTHFVNSIANRFIFIDKVNVLVDLFASAARVTAPLAAKNKIPSFHHILSNDVLKSKYNFINFATNEDMAERIIDLLNNKGIKNITMILANLGSVDEILEILLPKLKYNNITFVVERFNPTEKDFNILTGKIKRNDTEAVIVYAYPPALDLLVREFNRQNIDKTIVFFSCVDMSSQLSLFEGMYGIIIAPTPVSLREHIGFGEDDNAVGATFFYDTGAFITQAFEKTYKGTHIPTGDEVVDQLLSQKEYQGWQDVYTLDERGQFHSGARTYIVKNEKFVPVTED